MNLFSKLKTQILGGVKRVHLRAKEYGLSLALGERYVGIIYDKNGKPLHHLVLLQEPVNEMTWLGAARWAKSIGGLLPTIQELILIFNNHESSLDAQWYWSSEIHPQTEKSVFIVHLGSGEQTVTYKIDELATIAIRRIPIFSNQNPSIVH